jgi:hemolysin activation/secretion protein
VIKPIFVSPILASAALLAMCQAAYAQQVPDAGTQLQQIPRTPAPPRSAPDLQLAPRATPAESDPAGAKIVVAALHVTGATLFSEQDLVAVTGFVPGAEMNLGELRSLAAKISDYYNKRGYFLAQAYLPAQDVQGGMITIAVVEGRYGKVEVDNKAHLSGAVPRRIVGSLGTGDVVTSAPLSRRLLLLSDVPGIRVNATLSPGTAVGTSDLIVAITPGPRFSGSIEADNGGNRYTGAYRLGGTINLNNPLGIGDQLSVRVLGSTSGLAYGRVSYQAPIGNLTLGVAYSHIRYDLGREFALLGAHGTADVATVYASYPLIRSRDANLYALADIDMKWFKDDIDLVSTRSDKRSRTATLGFSGDTHDELGGGGWNAFSAGWTFGDLDIRSPLDLAVDALTARSDGKFNKLQFSAARLQTISGPLSFYASVRGQYAFDNLDTSEKMELGGAYGVRAYPEGEAYGDEGYVATAEARLSVDAWEKALPGRLQLIGFVDTGKVTFAHDPWYAGSNDAVRSGYGAGLVWAGPSGFTARASYARKLGTAPATSAPDKSGRFWFQLVKLF